MNFSSKGFLGKIIRLPLKLIPQNTILPILRGKLKYKKWIVGSGVHGCWLGIYEYEKQNLFTGMVEKDSVVYDIGANVGFYTLLSSALVGSKGKVFAFEPSRRNLRYLRRHLSINNIKNVRIYDVAVSDSSGEISFDDTKGSSQGKISKSGKIKVNSVSLDEFFAQGELLPPDYLKIDVEGAEALVLKGAMDLLRKYHPIIFLAAHSLELNKECREILSKVGYNLKPINKLPIDKTDEILALPRNKV